MRPIAAVVREIVDESEIALSALSDGLLNLSAYAKKIKSEVARRSKKEVSLGTIVVALCRYEIEAKKRARLFPKVKIESISTRTALVELTFAKTSANHRKLRALHENEKLSEADLLTITSGVREISLILPAALKGEVLKVFKGEKPTLVQEDLASLSLRFPAHYLHTPNTIFALIRPFALSRINIVEVVSTYTELTVVVAERDLQTAFAIMSKSASA
ncbi:MAG: hypothetical protein RL518_1404 [Pseudomonadota bacterium]|jgi:hypothetical protein